MTALGTTCLRSLGRARNRYATAVDVAIFLLAAGVSFVLALDGAEGVSASFAAVWCVSVARVLPLAAALFAMDSWSDERRSGRMEVLLSTAVRERTLTLGKFLAVWIEVISVTLLSLALTYAVSASLAPSVLDSGDLMSFVPGLLALAVQGMTWCAIALAVSSVFRSAAVVAVVSLALTSLLPRFAWFAFVRAGLTDSAVFGEMPLDEQVSDLLAGVVSVGPLFAEFAVSLAALFVASKAVASTRLVGRGSMLARWTVRFTSLLAVVVAVAASALVIRSSLSFELHFADSEVRFSTRTRNVLSESRGDIELTVFVSRSDPEFRRASTLVRQFRRESMACAGARVTVRFVDPRWDVSEAMRLAKSGVNPGSIVVSVDRRSAVLALSEGVGERRLTSAIVSITMPPTRRTVYWTMGHGESRFDDYGSAGMSDIARELMREGYSNRYIDLATESRFPADCALIVVAGPRDEFSLSETARIESYLRQGGRLAVLADPASATGIAGVLSVWGMRFEPDPSFESDLYVSDFSSHPVSAALAGSRVVFGRSLVFTPSAAAAVDSGADRISFTPLVRSGDKVFSALTERGSGLGDDTAIRPTRIIAIGDASFVMNARLKNLANANRDYFLNVVSYLAGSHAITSEGRDTDALDTGLDPHERRRFQLWAAVLSPLAASLVVALLIFVRRRR